MVNCFRRVTVMGVGLIGGSLARGIREKGLAQEVLGADEDPRALERALELGAIDRAFHHPEEAAGSELIVIATPVGAAEGVARRVLPHMPEGACLTDVGSVKAPLVRALEEALPPGRYFIGGHPVAGRERSGIEASSPELFRGAWCILTPTSSTNPEALKKVRSLWEGLGARVACMSPELHDSFMAEVSHLPHLVAYALMEGLRGKESLRFAAGGLRDFTRIASSDPIMWRDIFLANREEVLKSLSAFEQALSRLKLHVASGDGAALEAAFARIKHLRGEWLGQGGKPVKGRLPIIAVDGPAGAGKSTASRALAEKLGFDYIDTGSLYRAAAWGALRQGADPSSESSCLEALAKMELGFRRGGPSWRVLVDGKDVTEELRSDEVGRAASQLSAHPQVRQKMLPIQRRAAGGGGVVVDGRDMGTVVFPDAEVKFFLDASLEERARRRLEERGEPPEPSGGAALRQELEERDRRDSSREASPLRRAKDAIFLDTTNLTIDEVLKFMLQEVKTRCGYLF
ncbi:MAG: (d)CMP kinase [Nitrospinota bacterium]